MVASGGIGCLEKIRKFTKSSTSLNFPRKTPKARKKKVSSEPEKLDDEKLLQYLRQGNDAFLEKYIEKFELSTALQQYLIRSHRLKLISLYIDRYGFCKEAQADFLDFMEERLLR